jgi:hypothetical protein
MPDNVNITVNETIENVVINPSISTDVIDFNITSTTENVTIDVTPNLTTVNINSISGSPVTKTSDLTNDGEDGIHPFITIEDVPAGGLTSVGLTMPVAFSVANSPLTSDGTIAVTGAGTSSQYIRGDGQLATLPSGGGGGSSVNYYLNGSIAASVATYKQLSNTAVIGVGTDFSLTGNGLITQFLTDVGNPNRIEIPGGAWNFEMWFSMSSSGGTPKFYVELLKYNGTTFTSIANSSAVPETITGGTSIDLYLTSLAVPTTTLLSTDRLAIRVYIVNNSGGRTATLHTEDNHLCEILTTFSGGVTSLNGLTANTQYLSVGTTGTDFNINSLVETHTFNLPTASATNRGALSTTDWTAFNGKFTLPALTSGSVLFSNGTTIAQDNANFFFDDTNNRLGIGTNTPAYVLDVNGDFRVSTNASTKGIVITSTVLGNAGNFTILPNATPVGGAGDFTISTNSGARLFIGANYQTIINSTQGLSITAGLIVGNNISVSGGSGVNTFRGLSNTFYSGSNTDSKLYLGVSNSSSERKTLLLSKALGSYGLSDLYFCLNSVVDNTDASLSDSKVVFKNNGNVLINTTTDNGGKLQIKAPGALSTDIALRVRNSADSADIIKTTGNGVTVTGYLGISADTVGAAVTLGGTNVLQVGNSIATDQFMVIDSVSGSKRGIKFSNQNAVRMALIQDIDKLQIGNFASATFLPHVTFDYTTANTGIGTITPTAKLHIKAPGALSTDIALRVRNSADTGDLLSLNGFNGGLLRQGGGVGNITYGVDIAGMLEVGSNAYLRGVNYMNAGALIGGNASQDASSLLEVRSTTKGFLPPRMTNAQRIAIATPAVGLMVYCTDVVEGLYINKSTGWTFII